MGKYAGLNSIELDKKVRLIIELWETFIVDTLECCVETNGLKKISEYKIKELYTANIFSLREIFERTHQREDYFDRYHNLAMSNYKEIGLIAFWITKMKPFNLNTDIIDFYYDSKINEQFALHFIFNAVAKYAEKKKKEFNLRNISSDVYNEILYTMLYRDISKEAYGCMVELIAIATTAN